MEFPIIVQIILREKEERSLTIIKPLLCKDKVINIVQYQLSINKINRTLYRNAKQIQAYVTNCTEQRWHSDHCSDGDMVKWY